jgi:mannose-6-phosphate isomerase-like protein (cupin superfamily)
MIDDLAKQILKDVNLDEITPRARRQSHVGHWTSAVLLERGAYLKKMAKYGDGTAHEILREDPQHQLQLTFISRNGEAEMSEDSTHLIMALSGVATLVTGGSIVRPRKGKDGKTHGDSIEGGMQHELRQGDFVHVPAGIAHQVLVTGDKTVTYLTVKIQEAS